MFSLGLVLITMQFTYWNRGQEMNKYWVGVVIEQDYTLDTVRVTNGFLIEETGTKSLVKEKIAQISYCIHGDTVDNAFIVKRGETINKGDSVVIKISAKFPTLFQVVDNINNKKR